MSSASFRIECSWLDRIESTDIDRVCFAELAIFAGDACLTELEDVTARTVRPTLRCSGYQLARWAVANWWRLRWEPEAHADSDWRLSHSLGAAGGGYAWPNITFASDGLTVNVTRLPMRTFGEFHPVRYLYPIHQTVSAAAFEEGIGKFVEMILARLDNSPLKDTPLHGIWREVLTERANPVLSRRRKLEALAGYDPDEGPEELLAELLRQESRLGGRALEELAAGYQHRTLHVLGVVDGLLTAAAGSVPGAYSMRIRGSLLINNGLRAEEQPWQSGKRFARELRQRLGLAHKPISDAALGEIIGVDGSAFATSDVFPEKMTLAVRIGDGGSRNLFLATPNPSGRRFAACRLLGDLVAEGESCRLSSATKARTARQKFQRSFAQEFLCPIEVLRQSSADYTDEDARATVAGDYGVSERLVATALVNYGLLDREALTE